MKALIVDDERLARLELRRLLAAHPEVEVAGEARSGEEALALIPKLAPDLVFLDIQMPGMTGFDLLERLEDVPQVIFTTAYDQYAIQAFEVSALDYLLKPVAPARLAAALAKVRPVPKRRAWNRFLSGMAIAAGSFACPISSCWNPRETIHALLRKRAAPDSPVAECAREPARPRHVFPRGPQADRQLEMDREGGRGDRRRPGGHAARRPDGRIVAAAIGAVARDSQPLSTGQ
jgi:CheY-like chemotaxis protein